MKDINNNKNDNIEEKEDLKKSIMEVESQILFFKKELQSKEGLNAFLSGKVNEGILKDFCFILHDKDIYTKEDEEKNPEHKAGTFKKPHYHIYLRFENSRKFSEIGKWFGLTTNQVSVIEKRFITACAYAVHFYQKEKYQYNVSEVIDNMNYSKLIDNLKAKRDREENQLSEKQQKQADKDAREKAKAEAKKRKKEIINLIDNGTIRQFNLSKYVTPEEEVIFNNAIKIAYERRIRDLGNVTERNLQCIYISGKSGAGKTTFAKMICESLDYSYIVAGSEKDPFQSYGGQDCIIFDDISFESFHWKELLKISDNHTSSLAKARYRDKALQCKLLIITTTREPKEMANAMVGSSGEEKTQFYRRYKTYYKMTFDEIKMFKFNEDKDIMRYEYKQSRTNLVPEFIERLKMQKTETVIEDDSMEIFKTFFDKAKMIILDTKKYKENESNSLESTPEEQEAQIDLIEYSQRQAEDDLNKKMGFDDDMTTQDFFG